MSVRMLARARSFAPARLAVLASLLGFLAAPGPASSSVAPTYPNYVLNWGTAGGQFTAPSAVATDAVGNVYVADTGNSRIQIFDNQGHYITGWGGLGSAPSKYNNPSGIAVDADGLVYIADRGNNRVKVSFNTGILNHQWGSIGTGSGQFTSPSGIAVDAARNVYVSDGVDRIQKFDANGNFLSQWGATGSGPGQFSGPAGIAIDAKGNVYVADQLNHRVQKFSGTGVYLSQFGGIGSGAGQLNQPNGVAVDALGNVYVAELGNNRIQKFTAAGAPIVSWGALGAGFGQFDLPAGVAVDPAGNVFVAEINNARIQKFSGAGAVSAQATPTFSANIVTSGSGNGQVNTPYAVTTDAAGWVYVADTFNYRVQKFSGKGVYSLIFGSGGSLPGQLGVVEGIAVDGSGNIYVTSTDSRVEVFNSAGIFVQQWGTTGSGPSQFNGPVGIAVDVATGTLYVADGSNNRVQKFTLSGTFVTQWGTAGSGSGQFNIPRGIAVDRAGNVYVTDGNSRVQKFTSTGTFVTQWAVTNTLSNIAVDALGDVYVCNAGPSANIQKFRSDGIWLAQWGSYGNGNGQFAPPYGVTVDGTGNVYAADAGGNRIIKWVTTPSIVGVSDIGNDQGRQTRLRIKGASVDAPINGGVTGYAVYRRVDTLPAAAARADASSDGRVATPDAIELAGWDYLGTQPAAGDPEYSMVVPTLADANASSTYYTAYMVRALTPDPITHYDSFTEYGYSIDNLSPPTPTPFVVAYVASAAHLHWGVSGTTDFAKFRLYKGAGAGFVPAAGNLVVATTDTGYVDPAPAGSYYKLSAVDLNGNESGFAVVGPQSPTSVGSPPALAFTLDGARPNPTTGRTLAVSFSLPTALPAQLEMLDVMGRLVARREIGALGAGHHVVDLASDRPLAPGLYLVRLRQGANARVSRVMVIE